MLIKYKFKSDTFIYKTILSLVISLVFLPFFSTQIKAEPTVKYFPQTGSLELDTSGEDVYSVIIEGPEANRIFLDGPLAGSSCEISSSFFDYSQQWSCSTAGEYPQTGMPDRVHRLASYSRDLEESDFGIAFIGTRLNGTIEVEIEIVPCPYSQPKLCRHIEKSFAEQASEEAINPPTWN